jgi:Ca2+/Na+ antiporter
MSEFGKTLFSGSRFLFWTMASVIGIFLITMPFLIPEWTPAVIGLMVSFYLAGIALLLALVNPSRFAWAKRVLTSVVFLAYLVYAVTELRENQWQLGRPGSQSDANPVNALRGLIIIGIPCLVFTCLGRFTLPKEEEASENELLEESREE